MFKKILFSSRTNLVIYALMLIASSVEIYDEILLISGHHGVALFSIIQIMRILAEATKQGVDAAKKQL